MALVLVRWQKIPWSYPLLASHKLTLLVPLYILAPPVLEAYRRYWARLSWAAYGVEGSPPFYLALTLGFTIGWVGIATVMAIHLRLGWRQWQGRWPGGRALGGVVAGLLPLTLLIAGVEEILFRGVLASTLQSLLPWPALLLGVSFIFALCHLLWDGPQGIPQVPGLTLMGLVLMVARWATTGQLGLAWGLHAGWIFALALGDSLALTQIDPDAPRWLAGKPGQPLTGLVDLALLLLTGLGLGWYGQGAGEGWPG